MYYLSKQRNKNVVLAYEKYMGYIESQQDLFSKNILKLIQSDWYYNPNEPKCPHDAWLENLFISEKSYGDRNEKSATSISITLLNAYHNATITFEYENVISYNLSFLKNKHARQDWLYDEFRVSENKKILHEIEWSGFKTLSTWTIEAEDIHYKFDEIK
ncbi:MAG TPA: hypothetical protein PKC21_08305 [Oligoflexia bacterium]|nr:hypothetical protein [Oligoflexia bacterium]HMR25341.1 hypothetical protein [Oligoflexia bacterium]